MGVDIIDEHNKNKNEHKRGKNCENDDHGTHVAALAGGLEYGIATEATLYSVRVADCDGKSNIGYIIEGLHHTMKKIKKLNKPSVINLSLGSKRGFISAAGNAAIRRVVDKEGIPVVVPAGDTFKEASRYWPAIPDVINVGATRDGDAMFKSNYGPAIDILAPGVDIKSASIPGDIATDGDTATAVKSGTPMAAAIVSGAVAVLLQEQGQIKPAKLKQLLLKNAINGVIEGPHFEKNTPNKLLQIK